MGWRYLVVVVAVDLSFDFGFDLVVADFCLVFGSVVGSIVADFGSDVADFDWIVAAVKIPLKYQQRCYLDLRGFLDSDCLD